MPETILPQIHPKIEALQQRWPLTAEEFAGLERAILAEGVRDPLVLWGEYLIDGHHRFKICQKHNLPFTTVSLEFESVVAAMRWMFEKQNSQRNLTSFTRIDALAHIQEEEAAEAAERQKAAIGGGRPRKGAENLVPLGAQGFKEKPAEKTAEKIGKMAGVGKNTVIRVNKIKKKATPELRDLAASGTASITSVAAAADLEPEQQREVVRRVVEADEAAHAAVSAVKAELKKAEREEKIKAIEKNLVEFAPSGEFDVIVIDPPWPYDDGRPAESYDPDGRRASNPYPEMSMDEIAAIDLPAAKDCVLWLWTTHRFLHDSYHLLEQWGFTDKVVLTWAKDRMGLGTWLRSQSEFCIMAVKGAPKVRLTNQTTVLHGPLREHSRKPDEFYAMVDELCIGRKIDWFSRETRPGWEQFGNDTEKFDEI